MGDLRRLREAAKLAAHLSQERVHIGLDLMTLGVAIRGRKQLGVSRGQCVRAIDRLVTYEEIETAQFAILEHSVNEVWSDLVDDEKQAADWRT